MDIKLNLIIDSNYILYKSVFSLMKTRTLYGDLYRALEVNFGNYFKKYPFDNIYMVSDSRATNWRKKAYPEYKGTRKKDEEIDWEFVFNTYDEFKEAVKADNPRVRVMEEEGCEGDDWIFFLLKASNHKGYSTMIVGSDGDLQQLLDYRLNPSWINIQWRDTYMREKLFFPKGWKLFMKELKESEGDIFNQNNNSIFIEMIENLMEKCDFEEVNQEEKLFKKIIQGDKGDNIKSVIYTTQKGGREIGIGDAGVDKIWKEYTALYSDEIDFKDDQWFENVAPMIALYKKVDADEHANSIKENLSFNRRLVHLHQEHYPKEIMDKMKVKYANKK
jgi:5'-3' exonuclease